MGLEFMKHHSIELIDDSGIGLPVFMVTDKLLVGSLRLHAQ
jgi:hypothetical protein